MLIDEEIHSPARREFMLSTVAMGSNGTQVDDIVSRQRWVSQTMDIDWFARMASSLPRQHALFIDTGSMYEKEECTFRLTVEPFFVSAVCKNR